MTLKFLLLLLLSVTALSYPSIQSPPRNSLLARKDSGVELKETCPQLLQFIKSVELGMPDLPPVNRMFLEISVHQISQILGRVQVSFQNYAHRYSSTISGLFRDSKVWLSSWTFGSKGGVFLGVPSKFRRKLNQALEIHKGTRDVLQDVDVLLDQLAYNTVYESENSTLNFENVTNPLKRQQRACAEHMSTTACHNADNVPEMTMTFRLSTHRLDPSKTEFNLTMSSAIRCNSCHNFGMQMGRIPTDLTDPTIAMPVSQHWERVDLSLPDLYLSQFQELSRGWQTIPFGPALDKNATCPNPHLCGQNH